MKPQKPFKTAISCNAIIACYVFFSFPFFLWHTLTFSSLSRLRGKEHWHQIYYHIYDYFFFLHFVREFLKQDQGSIFLYSFVNPPQIQIFGIKNKQWYHCREWQSSKNFIFYCVVMWWQLLDWPIYFWKSLNTKLVHSPHIDKNETEY